MFLRINAALLSCALLLAVPERAVCMTSSLRQPGDEAGSATVSSIFDSHSDYLDAAATGSSETLKLGGRQLEAPKVSHAAFLNRRAASTSPKPLSTRMATVAIISSAILPGTGEMILSTRSGDFGSYIRGPIFFTLDVLFWTGYANNRSEGKHIKDQYMHFADEHWTEARFLAQHPCCADVGGCDTWQDYNELGASGRCSAETQNFFLYIPRELDVEEYYENLGKYDAFAYGWDDWTGQADFWTRNRTYYWNLRSESDKYLLRSDQFMMLLIINRVVSVIDTAWLAYRMKKAEPKNDVGWSIELKPGVIAPTLTIGYHF